MSTRNFSRYWLGCLFFFSFSFLGVAEESKRVWIFCINQEKPELLKLKSKKENTHFIDLSAFDSTKKQEQLVHFSKLLGSDDKFFFLLNSTTLVRSPLDIINYLRQMLDFIPNEKFSKIVSNLQFFIREDFYESIDAERAYYYLFRLQNKLEKIYSLKAYDEKEIRFNTPQKDLQILNPLEKSIQTRNISILPKIRKF